MNLAVVMGQRLGGKKICLRTVNVRSTFFDTGMACTPIHVTDRIARTQVGCYEERSFLADGMSVVLLLALATLTLHCYFNNHYGYFRDEFDFMSCGEHLAWGYVDHPPLIPLMVYLTRAGFGDSLRALRFLPALANSSLIVLGALIAREFGGRRFSLILTAACVAVAPIYLAYGSLVTTNCLEPLLWTGCAWCVVRAIGNNQPQYWLAFGLIAGIAMEEKYGIAVFVLGLVVGLLLTEPRRVLGNKWVWLGGLIAFLIFLPNLVWNVQHHWPFLELIRNVRASGRDRVLPPLEYFTQQILMVQPLAGPIWILGLAALFSWSPLKRWRLLGWSYVCAFVFFVALHGKNYYLAPIYPMLLAAGAVMLESGIERCRQPWIKPVTVGLLLAEGVWIMPLVVPVLPVDHLVKFIRFLPFNVPSPENRPAEPLIPQHYADQFGWEEMVEEINVAWQSIPPAQRSDCAIFAKNYGQAGAIDFFGPRYGLPPALSGHQTFFLWGPRGYSGNCMIVIEDRQQILEDRFEKVELVGTARDNPYAVERRLSVYLCHHLKSGTLSEIWTTFKDWH